jgi:uncharacterized protein YbjT (DUF2867 family)
MIRLSSPRVLVLGASGTTGSRVASLLRREGAQVREASRTPQGRAESVRFEWTDPSTYEDVLSDMDAVYFIAPTIAPDGAPDGSVDEFCAVASREGVSRVVVLSSSSVDLEGPGSVHPLADAVRSVRSAFAEVAVLRPSWFMSNVVGVTPLARSIREASRVASATAEARIAFVDPDDIARVACRLLLQHEGFESGDYLLTGPSALSFTEVAAELTAATGRTIEYTPMTTARFAEFLIDGGLPEATALALAQLDIQVAAGSEDRTTDTVERITGRAPQSFPDYIRRNRERFLEPVVGVQGLREELAARDTLVRMAWAVDSAEWSQLGDFFEDEVLLDYSKAFGTRQLVRRSALVDNWRDRLDPLQSRQHGVTGVFSDVSGDRATVRANVLVTLVARSDTSANGIVTRNGGAWQASLRRRDGVWRIEEFVAEARWTDGHESALMAKGPDGLDVA